MLKGFLASGRETGEASRHAVFFAKKHCCMLQLLLHCTPHAAHSGFEGSAWHLAMRKDSPELAQHSRRSVQESARLVKAFPLTVKKLPEQSRRKMTSALGVIRGTF